MNGHSQAPANNPNTSVAVQEQADTHRSLQQASQALELASNRIRQVRRSLLQLSESLPSGESLARIGLHDELRPTHDALLLTGADGVQRPTSVRADRRRLRNTIPLEAAVPPMPISAAIQTEHTTGSAATGLMNRLDVLRSMINADPSATTRGMRVAARQAMLEQAQNAPNGSAAAPQDDGEHFFASEETPEQAYASIQARYERLQHLLSTGNPYDDFQRTDDDDAPGPSLSIGERVTRQWGPLVPLNTDTITTSALAPTPSAPLHLPPNPPRSGQSTPRPLLAASPPSNAATISTTGTLGGSVEQHRLLLQDILLADYPIFTPEQARREIHFWRPGQDTITPSDSPEYMRPDNNRIFQYVAPPDTEIDSQFSQSQSLSISAESEGALPEERSSRRAWARLDADGDEIPPSEEEELERQRTSYRIRAQQRARHHISANQVDSARSFARLDSPRDMHGSVIDSTRTVPDVRRQQLSPPVHTPVSAEVKDSYVNPLPMPLESMVMPTNAKKEEDVFIDIVFPKNACIAGR